MYLKVHFGDEVDIKLGMLKHSFFTSAEQDQELFPLFKGVVMLSNQKANEGKL